MSKRGKGGGEVSPGPGREPAARTPVRKSQSEPANIAARKAARKSKSEESDGPGIMAMWFMGIIVIAALPFANMYFPQLTKEVVIGIDLGTTYSVVAVCIGGEIQVIEQDDGSNLLPSYVHFFEFGGKVIARHILAT